MSTQDLEALIRAAFSDSHVKVQDLTGDGSHFQATVITEQFTGLTMVKQHRLVYDALQAYIDDGRVHALALKTYTPEQWRSSLVQVG